MSASETSNSGPKLEKPGAGLPWWERLAARYVVFPAICRRWTWEAAAQRFQEEGRQVLAVFDSVPADRQTERVLVRRFTGMEDSSRHWSAAMTVEHLIMVGSAVLRVIAGLRRGVVPPGEPNVADFKPPASLAPTEARAAFERLLADATKNVPPMLRGQGPRFGHPWFGPLDAHQWNCLLAFHQGVHLKQIQAIRQGLGLA